MKIHTTNYQNTFIQIADDCPALSGEKPPLKGETKTVAAMQFELVSKNPYKFTSDEVFFQVFAERNDLTDGERAAAKEQFFSRGQPCFRASPLTKRYGWGIHCDQDGKVAVYGCETDHYQTFSADKNLKVLKAMKAST